jgi:hypothetical protein
MEQNIREKTISTENGAVMAKKPKPPLTLVVPTEASWLEPPRILGQHGRKLWDRVMSEYAIEDSGGVEMLAQACAALDRAEALREQIDRDGEVIRRRGMVKDHPALKHELACRVLRGANIGQARVEFRAGAVIGWPARALPRMATMSTKRTPINRPPRFLITPGAIAAFNVMRKLDAQCTCAPVNWDGEYWEHEQCEACEQWWRQHSVLHDELRLTPGQWPAVEDPDAVSPYPEGSQARINAKPDLEAQARYRLLEQAAAEAAKRERGATS